MRYMQTMTDGERVTVTKPCLACDEAATVEVDRTQFDLFLAGMKAQDAFPDLPRDEREILISGTHPDCWERMFGGEDSEGGKR